MSRYRIAMVLVALFGTVTATVAPTLPVNAGIDRGATACQQQYGGKQSYQGPSVARIEAAAAVQCPVATSPGPLVDGRPTQGPRQGQPPSHAQYAPPPAQEQPCQTLYARQPASISMGKWGLQVDWLWPDGHPDSHVNGDMASQPTPVSGYVPVDFAVSVAGQNHLYMWFKNEGATYGGTHGWSCQGGTWAFRDTCNPGGALTVCLQTRVTGPLQPVAGRPPDPAPYFVDQTASVKKDVEAGLMGTSPAETGQYSFLPSCWWVSGAKQTQTFELRVQAPTVDALTGAPDGRAITYVYRFDVGLQKVRWDYGDGATYEGDVGHPWTAATPDACTNAHTYERISFTGNPGATACPGGYPHPTADDACYRVTATETYAVGVTAYWFDGATTHRQDMAPIAPLVITPPPKFVRVQQIEGVPVAR